MAGELPLLQNENINAVGVTLVDANRLTANESRQSLEFQRLVLEDRVLGPMRPETELCGPDDFELAGESYKTSAARSYDEFLATATDAEVIVDDSQCDPRVFQKVWAVLTIGGGRDVLGSFTLYNVQILSVQGRTQNVSAMAMPGCEASPGFTLRETWSGIMEHLLENELRYQGRDRLQVQEWRFPTREGHRWKLTPGEQVYEGEDVGVCDRVVADLSVGRELVEEDGVPVKVRPPSGAGGAQLSPRER